ncbi:hypothetical protein ACHAQC_010035, partial [Fusarium culmorum]
MAIGERETAHASNKMAIASFAQSDQRACRVQESLLPFELPSNETIHLHVLRVHESDEETL